MTKLAAAPTAVLVAMSVATACRAQSPAGEAGMDAMDSTDQHAAHAVHEAMSGSMPMDPHLVLTPARPRRPPDRTSLDALDQRIPLSVARWHEHVNWCLPPVGRRERWRETRDGRPVFGPKSSIATADACAAVAGRFVPRLFGWMVHVMAFEGDDQKVIWGAEHEHMHP